MNTIPNIIHCEVPDGFEPDSSVQYDIDAADCWASLNPRTMVSVHVVPLEFYQGLESDYNDVVEAYNDALAQIKILQANEADYREAHELAKDAIVQAHVRSAELRIELQRTNELFAKEHATRGNERDEMNHVFDIVTTQLAILGADPAVAAAIYQQAIDLDNV